MIALVSAILLAPGIVFGGLAAFILVEVLSGFFVRRRLSPRPVGRRPVAVVVPAHNEAAVIEATLSSLQGQLQENDRMIVVADNCIDDTARIARSLGADVIERKDATHKGKGFALQFALDHLKTSVPPETVFFLDADCRLAPGALDLVAGSSQSADRAAQALYLMTAPASANVKCRVSAFAWAFMNQTRMRGLDALAGMTRVTGAGTAIPWRIAGTLELGAGEIVEDLALSIVLAGQCEGPILIEEAVVSSDFPSDGRAADIQHARWEHGSLRIAFRRAPGLVFRGLASGNRQMAFLGVDIAAPPLTILFAMLAILLAIGTLLAIVGEVAVAFASAIGLAMLAIAVFAGWLVDGRRILPLSLAPAVFGYIASKSGVYGGSARASTRTWTKTDRDPARGGASDEPRPPGQ
ncbi:MAG: glycosyltransferase [Alphaproteobacteria bacterium]|nr:glycosyltransferase [Alphaproteobacteria bacterium]